MTKLTSQSISAVRFPLSVMVVMLHTYVIDKTMGGVIWIKSGQFPMLDIFSHFVQADLANVSVSLFFIISGFLFFQTSHWSFASYKSKMSRRVRSLLVPYLLWNTLYILYVAAIGLVHPAFLTDKISFTQMSLGQIANAYWNLSQGLIPLWFIRDLMIVNIFAPVIYFLIKKLGPLLPIVLMALWIMQKCVGIPGIGVRCSAFYVLGAWASLNSDKVEVFFGKYGKLMVVCSLTFFIVDTALWYIGLYNAHYNQFSLAFGAVAFFCLIRICVANGMKEHRFLAEGSFFVFVFHMFILKAPLLLCALYIPASTISGILALLFIPLVTSYACLGIYAFIKRVLPRTTKVLMGQR